jgi:hypothetical protein
VAFDTFVAVRFLAFITLSACGCLSASLPNGRASCASSAPRCPSEYYCAADNTCWRNGSGPDLLSAAGRDLWLESPSDGFVADLPTPVLTPCPGLFCDDFESDVASSGSVNGADGRLRWQFLGTKSPYAIIDIDGATGALGTTRALRFKMTAQQMAGMISPMYQRYDIYALLAANVPHYVRILNGPTYARFFVKLSAQVDTTLGYLNFSAGDPGDLEIDTHSDGVSFNTRYDFGAPVTTRNPMAVAWTNWVCVEWENRLVDGDAGVRFRSVVSLNGAVAVTFEADGASGNPVEQLFGANQELRSDRPLLTGFTEWIDEVQFSVRPIGCQ